MKNAKNKPKPTKNSRAKSSKKTNTNKNDADKAKKVNRILLTIIITAFIVIAILNISQLLQLQSSKSTDNANQKDSNVIINNNLQDEEASAEQKVQEKATSTETQTEEPKETKTESPVATDTAEPQPANSTLTVYFVKVLDSGQISILSRPRVVPKSLAILTQTMKELLKGPTEEEISSGLSHFIPTGSKLNKVTLKDGVAQLDFNEAFRLNEYGSAGILAQLYQIVFTCTELPSIKAVKITINNATVKYLGGEGNIEIDFPLTRAYLDSL